jgi:hypothetical protein
MLGRYIDGLTSVGKDLIISALLWTTEKVIRPESGERCLVGNAEGWGSVTREDMKGLPHYSCGATTDGKYVGATNAEDVRYRHNFEVGFASKVQQLWLDKRTERYGRGEQHIYVGSRFDELCARFGQDRIVSLCKARAARDNRVDVGTRQQEVVLEPALV